MKSAKRRRISGFTLVELLVVIAIIAILAAILFPVFGRVRAQARETACITQMHDMYVALKIYREDFGKFPAVLLGYAQSSTLGADGKPEFYTGSNGAPIDINSLTYRPLTTDQKYLKDKGVFLCPDTLTRAEIAGAAGVTQAIYPLSVPLANQTVLFNDLVKENCCKNTIPNGEAAHFYLTDSYDAGPRVDAAGNTLTLPNGARELHYSLDWTGGSGLTDPPNQLKYPDPPQDGTVITWCTHHVAVAKSNKIMVLLLNGKAGPAPLGEFVQKGPLNYRR